MSPSNPPIVCSSLYEKPIHLRKVIPGSVFFHGGKLYYRKFQATTGAISGIRSDMVCLNTGLNVPSPTNRLWALTKNQQTIKWVGHDPTITEPSDAEADKLPYCRWLWAKGLEEEWQPLFLCEPSTSPSGLITIIKQDRPLYDRNRTRLRVSTQCSALILHAMYRSRAWQYLSYSSIEVSF